MADSESASRNLRGQDLDPDKHPLLPESGSRSSSSVGDEPLLTDHSFSPSFLRIRDGDGDDQLLGADDYPEVAVLQDTSSRSHDDYAVTHCHSDNRERSNTARNQLIGVSVLCLLFMIGEIIGGAFANSLALMTDATHMASDLAGFLISLFALWIASKPATKRMSFGFHRAEIIGALASILVIWVVTGVLLYLAVERVVHQDYDIDADDMLITAGCGVAFNIFMGIVLHSEMCVACRPPQFGHHGHSHGNHHHHDDSDHSHSSGHRHFLSHSQSDPGQYPSMNSSHGNLSVGINNGNFNSVSSIESGGSERGTKNIVIRAAIIHVLGDLVQSIGVLIAAYIIKFKPEWKIADPICTFLFSVLVLCTTMTILRDTFYVIMEAVPKDIDYAAVKKELESIEGVVSAHSLHIWSLTLGKHAVAVHLTTGEAVDCEKILQIATGLLRTKYKMHQSTIQVERFQHDVMRTCKQCIGPKI